MVQMVRIYRVYLETYGCTLNQSDSDIMRALLQAQHYQFVDNEEKSDVVIFNTCTVKGATENKILERIKRVVQQKKKLVIAGCLAVNEKQLRKFAPSAPIVMPSAIGQICDAVADALGGRVSVYPRADHSTVPDSKKHSLPRVFSTPIMRIPINEGCTSHCAFCQTRFARPFLRSYPPEAVVKLVSEAVVIPGAREIQLTSMDLGAYGLDIKTNLVDLLKAIAALPCSSASISASASACHDHESPAFRIRLGMINPNHAKRMLPDLLKSLEAPIFYKFLHIPVQTGCEKVCREMDRDHTVKDFVDIVGAVRKKFPEAMIATDVIAGYPTETDDDFEATKKLLQNTKPETVNLSKFSPRPGTKAKAMKQLPGKVIKQRSTELNALIKQIAFERRKALIGKTYRVLVTEKQRDFTGRNINYQQVVVRDFNGQVGDFVNVKIVGANHGSLFGEPV